MSLSRSCPGSSAAGRCAARAPVSGAAGPGPRPAPRRRGSGSLGQCRCAPPPRRRALRARAARKGGGGLPGGLKGIFEHDPALLLGLAQAQFGMRAFDAARVNARALEAAQSRVQFFAGRAPVCARPRGARCVGGSRARLRGGSFRPIRARKRGCVMPCCSSAAAISRGETHSQGLAGWRQAWAGPLSSRAGPAVRSGASRALSAREFGVRFCIHSAIGELLHATPAHTATIRGSLLRAARASRRLHESTPTGRADDAGHRGDARRGIR